MEESDYGRFFKILNQKGANHGNTYQEVDADHLYPERLVSLNDNGGYPQQ